MPLSLHTAPPVPRVRCGLSALIACALGLLLAPVAHADVITDWNVTAVRAAATVGISTGGQSRLMAMTHAAMFDAVNSIERTYTPSAVEVAPPAGASAEAAAITAAHGVLTQLVPDEQKMLDAALATTLATVAWRTALVTTYFTLVRSELDLVWETSP
jgi:hypothetical protein